MTSLPPQPLSPLDGRYRTAVAPLADYLSEAGLNRARVEVEVGFLLGADLPGEGCTVEDVLRAIEAGVDGVVLSNHGGRQLDTAPSGIEILAEVMPILRERNWQDKLEIYIDGGIRRATDIIKALCLGAKGVGIGRPFLYAMSTYGLDGVDRAMQLLKDEMEMNMRLIGATSIKDLHPGLLDLRGLQSGHHAVVPGDTLSLNVYDPLQSPRFNEKAKL